ncbi:LysR family transcriptional regulator [Alsobacter metallidurans]|uniref:LysR family transcriptional regulator n=1 Tax=Alsobacter metallidurans TaxID=340221 RepID=A0A917MHD0_9HYPH|nr:LysR family transcriptional regulator [Alsobacter metallidurans]GGH17041.1 LysR family transcriptional regulator [Alsobacter metallidurans]
MNPLPWDDFRLVKAIADTRSLTGAAETLGVNHSTVFRRLADIEKRVGLSLFERHRTGYGLTPAGEEMAALAERMDRDVAAFSRKLAGQALTPSGEVRVTTNDTLLVHLLMPVLANFRQNYPDIRVDMVLSNQALNLSKRDADIAVRATDSPPETLVGRRVASIVWAVYGRRTDFPDIAAGETIEERDLYDRFWVSLGDQFGHLKAARYVRDHVPAEKVAIKINTVLGLAEAVAEGIGVGPLPCFIADRRPDLVRLTTLNPDFSAGLWLLTHPDLRASPRIRAFLDTAGAEIVRMRALMEGDRPWVG